MFFSNINYVVIIIASILGMAVGFIWFAPWAFGSLWQKAGSNGGQAGASNKGRPMWLTYAMTMLGTVATAFVLSVIFNSLVVVGLWGIIAVGLMLWLGFIVPIKLNDYLFGGESLTLFLISIGHQLVAITVMAFIIGLFS